MKTSESYKRCFKYVLASKCYNLHKKINKSLKNITDELQESQKEIVSFPQNCGISTSIKTL